MKQTVILLLLVSLLQTNAAAVDEKEKKVLYTNLAAGSVIIGWGIAQWEYGQNSMHTTNEGWFGSNTDNGGADKLGHLYTTYAATRAFALSIRSMDTKRKRQHCMGLSPLFLSILSWR